MNVCLLSGLGKERNDNMNALGERLLSLFPSLKIDYFHYDETIAHGYDVYLGHSLGGQRAVAECSSIPSSDVLYLGLIDPVASWIPNFLAPFFNFRVPGNVLKADCFQRYWGPLNFIPPSSEIINSNSIYNNFKFDMSHADAPKDPRVINGIVQRIQKLV